MTAQTLPNPAAPPSLGRLVRAVVVVMGGFALTKGVSLLQTIIIAGRFGAGAEYDTFVQGSALPDYLVRLMGGGALGVAFIPVFSALLNQNDQAGAWKLASQTLNTLFLAVSTLSGLVFLFAPFLVRNILAPGMNAQDAAQTANIMRMLCLSSIIFAISGLVASILHGHNHFFLPVLSPIVQDLGLLFGVIFFIPPFGIYGLPLGGLLGAVLHLGVQVPGLVRVRFRWRAVLGWDDPRLRHTVALMVPRSLIGVAFLVNLVAIGNINSRLGEGAASAFSWALRFIDIPQALLGTATGLVIFPTLAALTALGEAEKRREAFAGALRFILVATIPATLGLVLVSEDALRLLFEAEDTALIFTSLQVMSLAVIIQSIHEVLTRAFYADQDTLRPLLISIFSTACGVATALGVYALYRAYEPPLWSPLAVGGPALAYVMDFAVDCLILGWLLRRRWGDIALPQLLGVTAKALAAGAVMVGAVLAVRALLMTGGLGGYGVVEIVLRVGVKIAVGIAAFTGAALALKLREVRELPRLSACIFGVLVDRPTHNKQEEKRAMKLKASDLSLLRIVIAIIAVVVGVWFAIRVLIPALISAVTALVALAVFGLIVYVAYQVLTYDPDKA